MFGNCLKYSILVLVISSALVCGCSAFTPIHSNNQHQMGVFLNSSDYSIFNHYYKLNKNLLNAIWINSSNIGGIQAAVDSASPGDTILLDGGTYNGTGNYNININKVNLTITASGSGGVPVIDAEGQGRIFNISSDNITLNGLKMINGGIGGPGGGIYSPHNINISVVDCSFTNTSSNAAGGVYLGGNGSVIGCSFINTSSRNNGGGVRLDSGSVVNCSFTNTSGSSGGGVYITNGSVIGCSFVGCSAPSSSGAIYIFGDGVVNYNRFVNNTGPGNGIVINGGSVNVDYNWFGNNTPDPIPGGVMNNYYQVQLSVNNNSTTTNTCMNFSSPVSLDYRLVLNGTNNTSDVKCLPDFNALIKLTGYDDTIINATDEWNHTLNGDGLIDFVACVDNEILNISLLLPHPSYDLRLHNSGSFTVGSWVDSVAEPVNGTPLDSDYAVFRVTKPNGESWNSPHTPFNNKVFSYRWQLTMKGKYLVEVWAYYTHGNHVKAPQSIKRYSSKNLVTVQSVAKDEFYVS